MSELLPVLVVDDEELLLPILKTTVELSGVKAVGAASGREALGLLEKGSFSAIVSDLHLAGGIGGAEIFDWVGQNRPELKSRFLLISGDVDDPYVLEIKARTGALFIAKPFLPMQLVNLIKKMIARNQASHV
jgi:DNA-binding NtrC family response regulator